MKFKIDELEILFPYDTIYPEQYFYMKRLKETLDQSGHCILEMPSGTGKTVCLFSLALAYLLQYPKTFEKIVYCSRTVTEMDKALGELKTLVDYYESVGGHTTDILALILSARKNLCINQEVLKERDGNDIDSLCYSRTAAFSRKNEENPTCDFFEGFEAKKDTIHIPNGIYDISEIKKFGSKASVCPYFLARKFINKANIIVYSYAYLLDPKVSSIVSKEIPENSIIIFDEAHNIDNACIEGMSIELNFMLVKKAVENLRSLKSIIKDKKNLEINNLNDEYKKMVTEFADKIKGSQYGNRILSNPVLPQDLAQEAIPGNLRKAHSFILTLSKFAEYIQRKLRVQHVVIESPSYFLREVNKDIYLDKRTLKHLHDQLTKLLQMLEISDLAHYRPAIQIASLATLIATYSDGFALISEPYDSKTNLYDPKIYFTCLDASIAMKPVFSTFKSVIITSGTLSPIDMYPKILDFSPVVVDSFSMSLARPCICPMVVSHGNDQIALSSRFESREDASVARNYGSLVVEMAKIVPDGMICFFPSYFYMEFLINFWNESGTLEQIQKNKLIFIETPLFSETAIALRNFKKACRSGRGAIFFSIARGKVSEGIDFSHELGRCVIMLGIPYMYTKSRILNARMEFMRENFLIRESEFLNFDALRHASQCLGRALRNKDDYGILLLADQRYSRSDKRSKLPKWITENLKDGFINLTTDDAVHYGKIFLRQMAQTFTRDDQIGISMLREDQLDQYIESNSGWVQG